MTPLACAAASPSAIAAAMSTASRQGSGSGAQPLAERLSIEQLHDREGEAVHHTELVDREDARVRQRRHGARLRLEALAQRGIGCDVRRHHLDRDVAIQTRITRAIHLSHAARRDGGDDLVLGKPKAGGK